MIGFVLLPLITRLAPFALAGLDWLRKQLLPDAPATTGVNSPYTPPYTGGQCDTRNLITVEVGVNATKFGSPAVSLSGQNFNYQGKVNSLTLGALYFPFDGAAVDLIVNGNVERQLVFPGSGGGWNYSTAGTPFFISQMVKRNDGIVGECGDTSNPNPSPSVSGDGLAQSPAPDVKGDGLKVVEGSPLALPSIGAAIAAAIAAAKAATDALDAVKALADAVKALKDLIDALNPDGDKKDKAKSVYRYDFGSIRRDGFLRLYPNDNLSKLQCSYVDIQVLSIPIGYGKFFGNFSPNFYRFKSLGYISFVSPTFGVMEVRPIEFTRCSFEAPENAFGFFYHLYLDGEIVANASAFYVETERGDP